MHLARGAAQGTAARGDEFIPTQSFTFNAHSCWRDRRHLVERAVISHRPPLQSGSRVHFDVLSANSLDLFLARGKLFTNLSNCLTFRIFSSKGSLASFLRISRVMPSRKPPRPFPQIPSTWHPSPA